MSFHLQTHSYANTPMASRSKPAPRFAGWFGDPLERVYMMPQGRASKGEADTFAQMHTIGQQEGFDTHLLINNQEFTDPAKVPKDSTGGFNIGINLGWTQDLFAFLPTGKIIGFNEIDLKKHTAPLFVEQLASVFNMTPKDVKPVTTIKDGANLMMGYGTDGEPIYLVNAASKHSGSIARELGVPQDRVFPIPMIQDSYVREETTPQGKIPEFSENGHMDFEICPISSETCLIRDFEAGRALLQEALKQSTSDEERGRIQEVIDNTENYFDHHGILDDTPMVDALKKSGFKNVIPIPGGFPNGTYFIDGFYFGINYMNSITHTRDDGGLVYITNDSGLPTVNRLFEEKLKGLVPTIKKVYFVSGETYAKGGNYIARGVGTQGGGIHCRFVEQPTTLPIHS